MTTLIPKARFQTPKSLWTVFALATICACDGREPGRDLVGLPNGTNVGGSAYDLSSASPSSTRGGPSTTSHFGLGGTSGDGANSRVGGSSSGCGTECTSVTGNTATGGNVASGNSSSGGTTVNGSTATRLALQQSECQAYYRFQNLANGKVLDDSGHGQTLTAEGAALATGPHGTFLNLPGTTSTTYTSSAIVDTTKSFSISLWVRFDQLSGYSTVVSQDGTSVSSFYLQKRDSGRFAFTTFPTDSVGAKGCITEGAIQPKMAEWYHLVATRNAETHEQRLYVDGMLSGKSTCDGGFATPSPLVIGRGLWEKPVDWVTGGVDELCVINRTLTPQEAIDLYQQGLPGAKNYLFAYFAEQAQGRGDGLRLAQSHDALYWGAIGAGKVFLPPTVGGKSFRDPHVMRAPAGTYHVVWTTSCVPWAESGCVQDKGFGHAESADLVHFSEPSYVSIALNVEHVWAPETFYDSSSGQFMVYWSSPVDNSPSASDPHSIFYVLTRDFKSFSNPLVLYSRAGRDFIDATIINHPSGGYVMFLKDEAGGQKNIRALSSTSLYGEDAWTSDPSAALTGNYGAEGPSVLLVDGQMHLFFDKYGEGLYGALRSNGLSSLFSPASWTDISSSVFFAGVRHGTPIEVPSDIYRAVALKAGE